MIRSRSPCLPFTDENRFLFAFSRLRGDGKSNCFSPVGISDLDPYLAFRLLFRRVTILGVLFLDLSVFHVVS